MRTLIHSTIQIVFLSICFSLILSCKGANSGFAPGAIIDAPAALTPENHVKYGEMVTTSNNWEVTNDNADSVDHKVLSNGWTVEVKYE